MNVNLRAVLVFLGLAASAAAMPTAAPLPHGENYQTAPVILDPGHGGDDLGAVVKGMKEKDIALAIALKLRDRLKGAMPVALTREDDNYVTLDKRVVESVDWDGAIFISIHLNKVRNKKLAGATVYSYGPEKRRTWRSKHSHPNVPPLPAPPAVEAKESALLAEAMVNALRADGLLAEKEKSDYYVLKNPAQPSILIEIGYLSNPGDADRLKNPSAQDRLVGAMVKAITAFTLERSPRATAKTASL